MWRCDELAVTGGFFSFRRKIAATVTDLNRFLGDRASLKAMADRSTSSITISAPPADIMAVIADFPAYPQWARSVRSCEVLEEFPNGRGKRVRLVIDAGVVRDDYELVYDWAPDDTKVSWHLVRGQLQKSQEGSYELEPQGESTLVTYTLSVGLTIPMLGLLRRKAEKVIMDTALKELKRRVEGE